MGGEGQNPQKPVNVVYGFPPRSNFSLSNRTDVGHGCSHCESYCFGENGGHYNDNPIFFLKSREMRLRDQKNQIFGSLSIRSVLTENGYNLTLRYEVKRGRT